MKPSPAEPLRDIVEAGEAIERFLAGVDFDQFTSSDALTSQIYWKLAVIGEAANRAMRRWPDMTSELPELINLAEVRNRVIHGYDQISNVVVWSVVKENLPPVLERIRLRLGEID
jgi:uncharacterized protein with HEPN domain